MQKLILSGSYKLLSTFFQIAENYLLTFRKHLNKTLETAKIINNKLITQKKVGLHVFIKVIARSRYLYKEGLAIFISLIHMKDLV